MMESLGSLPGVPRCSTASIVPGLREGCSGSTMVVDLGGQTVCFENATHFQKESLNRGPAQIRRRLSQAKAPSSTFASVIRQCRRQSTLGKDKNLVSVAGPRKGRR
jgi:hypothetical protein